MGKSKRRKQKVVVVREPNGRESRAGDDKEFAPAKVKRLRDAALRDMADARWGSELGRLYLGKQITEAMLLAGERWAELARHYDEAMEVSILHSPALERGNLATPPDPDTYEGRRIAARERKAVEDWEDANKALVSAGKLEERTVRIVCENNEMCGRFDLVNLTRGLEALVPILVLKQTRRNVRKAE